MGLLFPYHLRRSAPRQVFMAAMEFGKNKVKLACPVCGHVEGWVVGLTSTEMRRQPCPNCNAGGAGK